jgi:organic hydroperoxide reductase OsmC/OhrA
MAGHIHRYGAALEWRGNLGDGTRRYDGYGRQFEAQVDGKPPLAGSADAAFRGDPALHNPEDLLLIALSSCHMLSYLALCAREGIVVTAYSDRAEGVMQTDASGGGRFTGVVLQPQVTIAEAGQLARAEQLHATAHAVCYIASSCNFPVEHRASVEAAGKSPPPHPSPLPQR